MNNKIQLRVFGAFRKYVSNSFVIIETQEPLSAYQFRQRLVETLKINSPGFLDFKLIEESAIARDEMILNEAELIYPGDRLAILPPVCGG